MLAAEDDLPVFGEIKHVVADSDQYYLVFYVLHTICFQPHYHAYEVEHTSELGVVKPSELADHPLGLYTCSLSGQYVQLISLKYYVHSR